MNIYFPPIGHDEVIFPTENLSIGITDSIITTDELINKNQDIKHILNEKPGEISQFYKKYKTKNFEKTQAQKKLNKFKVYLIVKSKMVKGKKVNFVIPIRNYDDLGNSIVERSKSFIASLFYVKLQNEGSTASKPFTLDHLLATQAPFNSEEEILLKDLILPKKYGIDGVKLPVPSEEISEYGYIDEALGGAYLNEYDYNDSMIDNTFFVNVTNYVVDLRCKKIFNIERSQLSLLEQVKEINFKDDFFSLINISNFVAFVLGNKSALMEKNIIPVFSNLEDAQDLLITILEEVNQPFQVRRKIETANTPKYYRSLDYLDDSFSFQNRYYLPDPNSRGDIITDFLRKYRFIKPRNQPSYDNQHYSVDNYQTKGPFFVDDIETNQDQDEYVPMSQRPKFAPKSIWRESDYWGFLRRYFPDQPEEYSWWETRDMTEVDKGLLKKSQDIKIISMGLNDFLEFWNSPVEKKAEVLFIPSLEKCPKKKLPILSKQCRDRFYDYQQKFRGSKKYDNENYSYSIKFSS